MGSPEDNEFFEQCSTLQAEKRGVIFEGELDGAILIALHENYCNDLGFRTTAHSSAIGHCKYGGKRSITFSPIFGEHSSRFLPVLDDGV